MLFGEDQAGWDTALESPTQPNNSKGRRDLMRGAGGGEGEGERSPKKLRKGQCPKREGHYINMLSIECLCLELTPFLFLQA